MAEELRAALAKVETLSGLIPICSMCKDVRDESGNWSKIDEYIQTNTEARLSHGICPSCAKGEYEKIEQIKRERKDAG